MRILLFIVIAISIVSCNSLENLQPENISHSSSDVIFTPSESTFELDNGLSITVEPIDASSLNEETLNASDRSGDYGKVFVQSSKEELDVSNMNRSQRTYYENMESISEKIIENISKDLFDVELGVLLIKRMWNGIEEGKEGTEREIFMNSMFSPESNPYHFNNSYFSVFRLELSNTSNEVNNVNFSSFQIANGNELLYPLSIDYFENILSNHPIKYENALRYNLSENLIITPNQRVQKYFAVPAINTDDTTLTVQFIDNQNQFKSVDFNVEQERADISVKMNQFQIHHSALNLFNDRSMDIDFFYSIKLEDGKSYALKNDRFFVPANDINQTVQICGVSVANQRLRRNNYNVLQCSTFDDLSSFTTGHIE